MTGANARETTGTVRVWGGTGEQSSSKSAADGNKPNQSTDVAHASLATNDVVQKLDKKKKRKLDDTTTPSISDARAPIVPLDAEITASTEKKRKRVKSVKKEVSNVSQSVGEVLPTTRDETKSSKPITSTTSKLPDPSTQRSKRKADDAKVETVAKSAGGVDLTQVFGKPQNKDDDGGLGVGGW